MGFFPGKKEETTSTKPASDEPAQQTLSDVVRGMAHAASAADAIIDQQFIKQLQNFFDVMGDGKLKAKMVQVDLGNDKIVEVPLITMVDPAILSLDEVNINMVVKLTESKVAKRVHLANKEMEVTRSSFGVTLTSAAPDSRSDGLRVSMKFKRISPPEGATRLIDEMGQLIAPRHVDAAIATPSLTQAFANPSGSTRKGEKAETEAIEPKAPPVGDSGTDFPPTDMG